MKQSRKQIEHGELGKCVSRADNDVETSHHVKVGYFDTKREIDVYLTGISVRVDVCFGRSEQAFKAHLHWAFILQFCALL